jgi:UDP-2,4-diacetamido-2,4,6-trideoxy-beta-L-altropyranose hydrolase
MRRIFFRADGNTEIGLGHIIRCCAIADILRDDFECTFFSRQPSDYLKQEISKAGARLIEMPQYDSFEAEAIHWSGTLTGTEVIVLDGYHFETTYQKHIKARGCKLVCIDDIHASHFVSDIVINHSGEAKVEYYNSEFYTQHYLGFNYRLLRKAFMVHRTKKPTEHALLICLGGADPQNDTLKVWEKSIELGFSVIHILVGNAYKFRPALEAKISKSSVRTFIHQNLSAEEVANLMQECPYSVLTPSSIVLEYMTFNGIVFLYQIADNQTHLRKYLIDSGLAKDFTELSLLSKEQESSILFNQGKLFDNRSPERILQIFKGIDIMAGVKIDRASVDDLHLTYLWANDAVARKMSYNNNPILEEEHGLWFLSRLKNPSCFYYILKSGNQPFAQIRFEENADHYVLSYFIEQEYRGKGLASFILSEGIRKLKQDLGGISGTAVGYVKEENVSSCRSFEKMNFQKESSSTFINSFKYTLHF